MKEAQYNAEAADKAKLVEEVTRLKEIYDKRLANMEEGSLAPRLRSIGSE